MSDQIRANRARHPVRVADLMSYLPFKPLTPEQRVARFLANAARERRAEIVREERFDRVQRARFTGDPVTGFGSLA
jgi:hypothetical protein